MGLIPDEILSEEESINDRDKKIKEFVVPKKKVHNVGYQAEWKADDDHLNHYHLLSEAFE